MLMLIAAGFSRPALAQMRWLEVGNRLAYYDIFVGSTPIGRATFVVKPLHHASRDTFVQIFISEGLFNQRHEVTFLKNRALSPVQSVFESQKVGQKIRAEAAYSGGRVEGVIRKSGRLQDERHFTHPAPAGLVDSGMLRYVLTLLQLEPNVSIEMPVLDVRDGKLLRARGWVSRIDSVSVPAGRFRCYRVEFFSGFSQEISFVEVDPPHRLVRQLYPGLDVDLRLVEVP